MPLDAVGFAVETLPIIDREPVIGVPLITPFLPPDAETADILSDALRLIERGWCRRCEASVFLVIPVKPWRSFATRYCSYGAIVAAARRRGVSEWPAMKELARAIGRNVEGITAWNDRQDDKGVVIAAFRSAICG